MPKQACHQAQQALLAVLFQHSNSHLTYLHQLLAPHNSSLQLLDNSHQRLLSCINKQQRHEAGRLSQEAGRLPHGLQLQQLQSNLLRPAMPQLAKAAGAALGLADQGLVHLLLRKLFSCLSSLVVGHRATRSKSTMHKTSKVCLRGCPVY